MPLRTPANDHFLLPFSSDLGGVLLFRIHCQEAAVLRLSRLGCVMFFVYVAFSENSVPSNACCIRGYNSRYVSEV